MIITIDEANKAVDIIIKSCEQINSEMMKLKIKIEDLNMSYEIKGKVKLLPDTQTFGSGFKKRELILTTDDEKYPQDISIEFLQEKIELLDSITVGQIVTINFNIRGREYNGKYFNNLTGWKISSEVTDNQESMTLDENREEPENFDNLEDEIPF